MLFKKYGIVCHRLKVYIVVAKQQGFRHGLKFLTLVTIQVLITHYTIALKVYEPTWGIR